MQNKLIVLMSFRELNYAVLADIEGIKLRRITRMQSTFLAVFWREDPRSEVDVIQYTRFIFDVEDSPSCAHAALKVLNKDGYLGSVKIRKQL